MRKYHIILSLTLLVTVVQLQAINPVIQLKSLSKERGLQCISTNDNKSRGTKTLCFRLNARSFLSNCHFLFNEKNSKIIVTLRPKPSRTFQGVTAPLAHISKDSAELDLWFSLPARDLENYLLEFQCYVASPDGVPSIGGELYQVLLQNLVGTEDVKNRQELLELLKASTSEKRSE